MVCLSGYLGYQLSQLSKAHTALNRDHKKLTSRADLLQKKYTEQKARTTALQRAKLTAEGFQRQAEMKVEEITDKGIIAIDNKGKRSTITVDTVILSLGFKLRTATVNQFKNLAADVYIIGDCQKAGTVKEAVHDGFNVAVEI